MPKADIQVLVCGDDVRVLVNGHLIDVQLLRFRTKKLELDPLIKLKLLCAEAKEAFQRDPRAGGMSFVGRPRVVLRLLLDIGCSPRASDHDVVILHRAIVIGSGDEGAIVGHWQGVPILVRCSVRDDNLYVMNTKKIPPSKQIDRKQAGQIRIRAHAGRLEELLTQEA